MRFYRSRVLYSVQITITNIRCCLAMIVLSIKVLKFVSESSFVEMNTEKTVRRAFFLFIGLVSVAMAVFSWINGHEKFIVLCLLIFVCCVAGSVVEWRPSVPSCCKGAARSDNGQSNLCFTVYPSGPDLTSADDGPAVVCRSVPGRSQAADATLPPPTYSTLFNKPPD